MKESFGVGQKLMSKLDPKGLAHTLVISDGLIVNGTELVKGLISKLPKNVALTGGLAGDGLHYKETLVGLDAMPKKHTIALIGFYGKKLKVGYGSMGGFDSFGPERLITSSKGNVLYTLDNKLALKIYKEYLGDQAKGLPASGLFFPLCIRSGAGKNDIVRTIASVNEKEQSLTFAGDVPEGFFAHLMRANFDHLIGGSAAAAALAHASLGSKKPDFALLVSCIGRKLILKQRIDEEIEVVQEKLGKQVVIAGFYSYGEICPFASANMKSEFHNQTMTITTFSEK
ncbi:FIST C-terminal domain-containing protein, partial [Candidatus Peregrinibacteria bacterium]|nr:FIST C-terminal domain-containing protein [Candidatus Peregrinibacteria bacterium]